MSCPLYAGAATIRVTEVDQCGAPVVGPDNAYVTECFASIAYNNNVSEGTDIEYKSPQGVLCGYKRGCPTLLGFDLEMNIHNASPELIGLITGSPAYLGTGGDVIGFDTCSIPCDTGFALELWAEIVGSENCEGALKQYLYFLTPWVTNGLLGDMELGAEAVTFQLTGATRAGGQWGVGPWDVQPGVGGVAGPMLTPLGATCHRRIFTTTVAPPVASCDPIAVPA